MPLALILASIAMPAAIHGQTLFSENFDTDHTANWTVNASAGTHPVNVFFDYSTIGIPSAPNSVGTTRGLKLQANTVGGLFGGVSVSPTGQGFTGNYRLRFDLWMNFNGPLTGTGNGTTQLGGAGIGTRGGTPQWAGGTLEGVWFAGTGEGGTTSDYRAYSAGVNNYAPATGVYNAGTTTTPVDARNSAHAYYSSFGGKTAPPAQLGLYPQQTGATPTGTLGFTWLDVTVTKSGQLVSWAVNGIPFATVDASSFSLSTNILLNYFDLNATTSTDPNAPALLFALFDNLRVEVIPASFAINGGGAYCAGGSGVVVGLSGSETGVDYLLRTNGVYAGVTMAGTGAAIAFGNQIAPGSYSVLASNTLSATTLPMNGTAVVTVNAPPAIGSGPTPANAFKPQGETVSISITATGTGLTYQWQRDGTNLANGGNITGATSATLTLNPLQLTDAVGVGHGYTCAVSGDCAPSTASGEATLTVVPQNHWQGDGAANQWDLATANWRYGLYLDGANTSFDDFGSNNVPVEIVTTVNPSWTTVNATGTYVFSGSGSIAGSGGLTKTNSGELKVATANTYSGATLVAGGHLTALHNHALGTTSGSTTVSNTGSVQIEGVNLSIAEPLVAYAPQSYNEFGYPTNSAINNPANTNTWSGAITLGAPSPIRSTAGLLKLTSTTAISGPGGLTLTGSGDTLVTSDIASSVPYVEAYGAGKRALMGNNASSGSVSIRCDATVAITNASAVGMGGVNCNCGTLEITGDHNVTFPLSVSGGRVRVNGGIIAYARAGYPKFNSDYGSIIETINPEDQLIFNTPILDDFGHAFGSIAVTGPGTVALNSGTTAATRYLGYWSVFGGTLRLNHPNAISSSTVYLHGGSLETGLDAGAAFGYIAGVYGDATLKAGRSTLGAGVSNFFGGLFFQTDGSLTVVAGAHLSAGSDASVGFGNTSMIGDHARITVQNNGEVHTRVTLIGELSDNSGPPYALIKNGDGSLVLLAANSFRGGTIVSNGTVIVANIAGSATGPGDVIVHDGATLMGNGRISGAVNVKSGGTLAPGASIGALVISNNLVFEAGATNWIEVNLASGTNDVVIGLTNVVYAGTLVISNVGPQAFTNGAVFKIFGSLAYSGVFTALLPAIPGPGLSWDVSTLATDGTLRVQAPNVTPVLENPIPDHTNTYGGAFIFTFGANSFSDPDAGQTLSYAASNLPPGIAFDGPTRTFSGTPTNVGLYAVTVTAMDDGAPPMNTNTTFLFVVNKAPLTLQAENQSRGYGAAAPVFTMNYSGFVLGETSAALAFTPIADCLADTNSAVGNYPITVTGGADAHYEPVLVNGTLTVTNVPLVVQAHDLARPVGQTNPPLTGAIVGLVNGDNITPMFETTATPASPAGDYPITVAGYDDPNNRLGNYTVTTSVGTLSVFDCALNYQMLHTFGDTNRVGSYADYQSGFLEGADGKIYGTMPEGGYGGYGISVTGVVYVIHHDGTGYRALHNFIGGTNDGATPGSLVEGSDGVLYGTTRTGGSGGGGTVYKLNKDGTGYGVIRSFSLDTGQMISPRTLIAGTNEVLYGWAEIPSPTFTTNVVFRMNRDGSGLTVVHEFNPLTEDRGMGLLQGNDGMLYGTFAGGGFGSGAGVFRMNQDGSAYSAVFINPDWFEFDEIKILEGTDGVLYGTAWYGASFNGSVFKLNRDGSGYAELFDFPPPQNGFSPTDMIEGFDGNLYGGAVGALFRIGRDGSGYSVVHTNGPSRLLQGSNGALYCTSGTIFTVATNGSNYSVLWEFDGGLRADACFTSLPLIEASNGKIYGTSRSGGSAYLGAVYRMNSDGSGHELVRSFTGGVAGDLPEAGLLEGSDHLLYGTTTLGGTWGAGMIYRMNQDGSGFAMLHSFDNPDGRWPLGSLVEGTNGALYGLTRSEGANNRGTLYKINRDGTGFATLHDFTSDENPGAGIYDSYPGLLVGSDGRIYGTVKGELYFNSGGKVFRINADGSGYTVLRDFGVSPADGTIPVGSLLEISNQLYGVTADGGSFTNGTVFRMNLDGSSHQVLRHFGSTPTDAKSPRGALVLGPCGALYGTTVGGGVHGHGTVFRMGTDGSNYSVIHDFNAATGDGRGPIAGLYAASNGGLYGTTYNGGAMDIGTVFKLASAVATNSPPVLVNAITDQTNTYGSALVYAFPANTFTNAEPGQTLNYNASNLPPGISFDGPTRTFSGTPTNVGLYAVTVAATDDGAPPLGTNDVFNFVISPAPLTVTANDATRFFGQLNPLFTGSLVGVTNGDNIAVTFDTTANPASPAGTYPLTPVFTDADNRLPQYAVTTNLGTLSVICATNLVVTTTSDSGYGSLREAITLANASCAPGAVLISFNIPNAGVHSIAPLTALPGISRPVVIDGYTQPGASANTLALGSDVVLFIELSGTNIPGNTGLYLGASAAGSAVRGLVVSHFSYGIALDFAQNIVVEGCFIGTDATGTNAQRNDVGIAMSSGAGHRIGGLTPAARNVISGNSPGSGIWISGSVSNLIIGNYVGLGADGLLSLPNGAGIYVSYAATGNQIGGTNSAARNVISANGDGCYDTSDGGNFFQGNFIGTDAKGTQSRGNIIGITLVGNGSVVGGATAGAGNLVSGRNSTALIINGSSNVVAGNFIGTDVTGQLALGNEYDGLLIYGSSNVIGGTVAAARNVIAANRYAVFFVNPNATGNRVIGNFIGTDVTGTNALGNNSGVVAYAAPANLIGGEAAGEGNVISGNTNSAIYLTELISTNYVIQGNFIGTDVSGDVLLPNGSGIYVGTAGNLVGGTNTGAGNLIAGNNGVGVTVDSYSHATNNAILGNRIFGNGALGIDLAGAGANDLSDTDDGPNHFQNSPALTNVMVGNGLVQLSYAVDSAPANAAYPLTIEFFLADSLASGEGRTLIHRATYATPQAFTSILFAPLAPTGLTDYIVATATDANGNTSECSQPAAISPPTSPTLNIAATVSGVEISWPAGGFNFALETTTSLTPPINWQAVTNDITTSGELNSLMVTNSFVEPIRFFRLRVP